MEKKVYLVYRVSERTKEVVCVADSLCVANDWIAKAYRAYSSFVDDSRMNFRCVPVSLNEWYNDLSKYV